MLSDGVITTRGLRATMNKGYLQRRGLRTIPTVHSAALVHSLIYMQVNSSIFEDPEPFGRQRLGKVGG